MHTHQVLTRLRQSWRPAANRSARLFPGGKAPKLNLVADCLALAVAALVATPARDLDLPLAFATALASTTMWVLASRALRHYDVWNGRNTGSDVALTVLTFGGVLVVIALLRCLAPVFGRPLDLTRFALVAGPAILWVRMTTCWLSRREPPARPALIVGIGPLGRHTALEIRDATDDRHAGRHVLGFLRYDGESLHDRLPAPVLGEARDLEAVLRQHVVDEVFLAGQRDEHHEQMQRAIAVCERFGVPFALPAGGFRFVRAEPLHKRLILDGYIHYLSVRHKPLQLATKRAIDILVSSAALFVLSPLLLVVALLVKISSRGQVLFHQERVGQHGRRFHMLKFRSMVENAEELKARLVAQNEQAGPVFKMKHDPRITPVGRFIRKYSIDELPQLINVLRGEMSLVGPRPPIPAEVARYEAWQRRRLSVRPGLTCVWQVSGRNQISFEEWMYLDMQYIDHWSLSRDLELIARTVPVVLTGRGAS
jgi:exopolysaccharide biosynthesis polyprenyl glycosylphosphotransferase